MKRTVPTVDLAHDQDPIPNEVRKRLIYLEWELDHQIEPLSQVTYDARAGERGEFRKAIRAAKATLEKMEALLR